jgi:hypothetical protein
MADLKKPYQEKIEQLKKQIETTTDKQFRSELRKQKSQLATEMKVQVAELKKSILKKRIKKDQN